MYKFIITAAASLFSAAAMAGPVNINTADATTLDAELNGVGPVVAQRIVDYRVDNGRFEQPTHLELVKGVGPKTMERNAADILVD